ncbi:hypothetical protein J7443_15965 [Tropicibacter sp. R15_0]|uniref:hypothetical protein n=1 Tax=Tropicibacter sp. R15_0 TaxID=2821101 RepID=UPI001ADA1B37|nr:hypothetical protein [Tropicibacter sp. R15_0]MBO9466739.1 hypothetical protein [Tropicibacter sp. R15_0]
MVSRHAAHAYWSRLWVQHMDVSYDPLLETLRIVAAHQAEHKITTSDEPVAKLLIALPRLLARATEFNPPGQAERSFDETWLLALSSALRMADADNYRFLLLSRMAAQNASEFHFLFRQALTLLDEAG